jgi:hypothetical protein
VHFVFTNKLQGSYYKRKKDTGRFDAFIEGLQSQKIDDTLILRLADDGRGVARLLEINGIQTKAHSTFLHTDPVEQKTSVNRTVKLILFIPLFD